MQLWSDVFYGTSLLAVRTGSVDRVIPVDSRSDQAELSPSGSRGKRPSAPIAPALPLLALLLGCVLLVSICNRSWPKAAKPGSLGRRLAGDEGDEGSLSESERELLCAAAQEWAPVEPQSGEPRSSPRWVGAFFESLGEPSLFEEGEAAAPQATQARERDDGDSEEEQPGPSSKFMRTEEGRQPAGPPAPSSAAPPAPSASPTPGPSAAAWQSGQAQPGPASAGILPVTGAGPSTSSGTPAAPAAQAPPGARQPRPPLILPGVTPREWRADVASESLVEGRSLLPMHDVCALLRKPVLDAQDVNKLMNRSEVLANYMLRSFKGPGCFLAPSKFVVRSGIRFLAFSQLYAAVQAVGRGLPMWWQHVADAALRGYTVPVWKQPGAAPTPNRQLADALASALALYRSGSAPSDEEVRRLMRLLLTDPDAPSDFRGPEWDTFRKDL